VAIKNTGRAKSLTSAKKETCAYRLKTGVARRPRRNPRRKSHQRASWSVRGPGTWGKAGDGIKHIGGKDVISPAKTLFRRWKEGGEGFNGWRKRGGYTKRRAAKIKRRSRYEGARRLALSEEKGHIKKRRKVR